MENFEQARVISEALWNTYSKTSFPLFELKKGKLTERVDELEIFTSMISAESLLQKILGI